MKRICKFITIPCSLFDTPDLSVQSKFVLIAIDSVCPNGGYVGIGVQALTTLTNLTSKEVKSALLELREHGAIEVRYNEENRALMKPLLYKDSYPKIGEKIVVGDKPTDSAPLPYDEIAEKWAEICVTLPKITRWSPQRKNKLRSVLKQADLGVEDLYKVFRIISCTPFLSGESDKFKCSFEWLISKSSNLEKVYTGFYARSYSEKSDYERIMNGGEVCQKQSDTEDFYR